MTKLDENDRRCRRCLNVFPEADMQRVTTGLGHDYLCQKCLPAVMKVPRLGGPNADAIERIKRMKAKPGVHIRHDDPEDRLPKRLRHSENGEQRKTPDFGEKRKFL